MKIDINMTVRDAVLGGWMSAPEEGVLDLPGTELVQALVGAIASAERLAPHPGDAPGEWGVDGAPLADTSDSSRTARAIYRSTEYWVSACSRTAIPTGEAAGQTYGVQVPGLGQILTGILVVGLAAIVASAAYATITEGIRIWSHHAERIAAVHATSTLAATYVAAGKPIPKSLLKQLDPVSMGWRPSSRLLWGGAAAAATVTVGAVAVGALRHD